MKKRWIAGAVALLLLMTGCAAPHVDGTAAPSQDVVSLPESTPEPSPAQSTATPLPGSAIAGKAVYRPETVPSAFAQSETFSSELYALLTSSIRAGSDEADPQGLAFTDEQFEGVRAFLLSRNPWGTLTDITRDQEGAIKLTYATEDVEERALNAQKFDEAVSLILETTIPEGCTQLSAAVALYKYVAQTIEEDYEAADGGLYGALVLGKGVESAYAYAYSFLLDQIGVQNTVVFSEDGTHAWNVLTMEGMSFHCDPQVESGLNGGQALTLFGLSDRELSEKNGWNTYTSENRALLDCDAEILTGVKEAPYADVETAGNALYFTRMEGLDGVFRFDLSSGDVIEVAQAQPTALAVLGDNVYYLEEQDSQLYRYRTSDGDVRQVLEGVPLFAMRRVAGELRYIRQDSPEQEENVISLE